MRRADLRDVDLQPGVLADEDAGRARVVEVDVREQQVTHVVELEPVLGEAALERRGTRRGPAVEEGRPVLGVEQVGADHALVALVVEVEQARVRHPSILGVPSRRAMGRAREDGTRSGRAACDARDGAPATLPLEAAVREGGTGARVPADGFIRGGVPAVRRLAPAPTERRLRRWIDQRNSERPSNDTRVHGLALAEMPHSCPCSTPPTM